ncbi:hypothetical protein [Cohnella hashimotonis]|uniref:VCBS repeat-containing protein n=1 Tax=Cohnella hashimotonis TaxID=2826895 RepID=A0ABT6TKV7_9BACL|nr:hypothetical protein [Cohnella hashimotonis]MDI4647479.1 hypothetical protein [Cohnella hashimotonis]
MFRAFYKNSHKCSLLGLAVTLLISGCCGLTNGNLNNNPKQSNSTSSQTNRTKTEKRDVKELSFELKETSEPQPGTPGEDWTVTKEQTLGDTAIVLYQDGSGSAFDNAFAKYAGNSYKLNSVYNSETVRIQPLKGEFGGIQLIGGVGSDQTAWDILGVNKQGKFVMFTIIGQPQFADLDGDGTQELIATFKGAHLNFPDVEVLRVKDGHMESAKVINGPGGMEVPQHAHLLNDNGSYLIEIGKVREDGSGRQYRYDKGRLVQNTY